ncbi:MAG: hypothetical protein WC686_03335 [Candidatus Shapirobacteria bacterium]|jgi:hypothetical protein
MNIQKIDEKGKVLEECLVDFGIVLNTLYEVENCKLLFPLLCYIDIYGDTYFNRLQNPDLVDQFSWLKTMMPDKAIKDKIDKIVNFIVFGSKEVHLYIKFLGD